MSAHVSASGHKPIENFIGPVGAWIAFCTFQAFGLAAYGLMVVLAVIGATLLLGRELPWRGKVGAGFLLLVSLSCLLHVMGLERAQHALNLPASAGGFLGLFVGGFFQRILGTAGTMIIFCCCVPHQPDPADQFPSKLLGGVDRRHGNGFLAPAAWRQIQTERRG